MGRCGGWIKGMALFLVALIVNCGDTGGNKSPSTGNPFVFQARARLNLAVQVAPNDPKLLRITATLLDPQGNPFRNQRVTFEAEFPEAIFLPPNPTENDLLACLGQSGTGNSTRCTNRGAAITDDNGQARVTLFSIVGSTNAPTNPDRLMRVIAEAPNSLDVASAISVPFTTLGFLLGGDLSITPPEVTLVNPLIQPGTDGPSVTFTVQGGRPPYRWTNANQNLGRLTPAPPTACPGADLNQCFVYTIIGAIPTPTEGVLTDTVTVTDAAGATVTATVTIIFADCELDAQGRTITITAPSPTNPNTFSINVADGVPPFTVTEDFPGTLTSDSPETICADTAQQRNCELRFTLATPLREVNPDTIIIRDSRGCTAQVQLITELCGNGVLDAADEECDGDDLGGETCESLTPDTPVGTPRCSSTCTLETSSCVAEDTESQAQ
jgi:hypothetical protein